MLCANNAYRSCGLPIRSEVRKQKKTNEKEGNHGSALVGSDPPPLDEVEPNLKKIPHGNGILGLEANSM